MTDAFALLGQPRRPWLDPEQLKQAFHDKALQLHPDAHSQRAGADGSGAGFAELNEAYRILRDPRLRLQHLLALSGHTPEGQGMKTPGEIEELFPLVAAVTQHASAILQQSVDTSTALSRSLLKPQLLEAAEQVADIRAKLTLLQRRALARTQEIDRTGAEESADYFAEIQDLYLQLSYLARWTAELDEKHIQLSNC